MEIFNQDLLQQISSQLLKKKQSIAIAESVTGGLLQFAFSSIPGASDFFQGGLTAYNVPQKCRHLQVEPLHAMAVNGVSPKVAMEMTRHAGRLFLSDWAIGITGYASPVPESEGKLFAYYAIFFQDSQALAGRIDHAGAEPYQVQVDYINIVLEKLAEII